MLRIKDPTDPENDVGIASYKLQKVIKAMGKLRQKIQDLGPGMEEKELDQLLSGTPGEKTRFLKQKVHEDRNNQVMYLKLQKRVRKMENKTNPSKAMQKNLARMREKCEEFMARRPGFAAEMARADYLLKGAGGPERDLPGPERGLAHDTLMINPAEENMQPQTPGESIATQSQNGERPASMEDNEGKSPWQLEKEAKHAATIAKKREKREKMLQKRAEKRRAEKEKKAQKRMEAEMNQLKKREEE